MAPSMVSLASLALGLVGTSQAMPASGGGDWPLGQLAETTFTQQGFIPTAVLGGLTPDPTSGFPTSDPTGLPTKDLKKLWAAVEDQFPVQEPAVTSVQPAIKNFTIPPAPPPFEGSWVKYTTDGKKFPKGFYFGVATAAQQVEGAAKHDGRGPSTWDYLCHQWPASCTNSTSDVSDNQYYLYKQDSQRLAAMGVNAYSFTLSWPRIFPYGSGEVEERGLKHYDDFLDDLHSRNIEPVVTLFHWDTPLSLLWEDGAIFSKNFTNHFEKYAETVFRRYGKKVKKWFTFNEPRVFCSQVSGLPYSEVHHKYGVNATSAPYSCTYNILRAHAHAVKVYRKLVKDGVIPSDGEIAFKSDDYYPVAYDQDNAEDREAAKRHEAFYIGIFAEPVYLTGNYPEIVLDTVPADILPRFTDEEKALLKGSADFFAIDGYRTNVAKAAPNGIDACKRDITDPNWPTCQDGDPETQYTISTGWPIGSPADVGAPWLWNTGNHLRDQLKFLTKKYPTKGGIYLTEFGLAEPFEHLRSDLYIIKKDAARSHTILDYLNAALLSVTEDGVDLRGTFIWSSLDNFEWGLGLGTRFGLQYVNFSDPELPRTYKHSFYVAKKFFEDH